MFNSSLVRAQASPRAIFLKQMCHQLIKKLRVALQLQLQGAAAIQRRCAHSLQEFGSLLGPAILQSSCFPGQTLQHKAACGF